MIYSLLALVLPFLLLLIIAVAVISPANKDEVEKTITNNWTLITLAALQLLALDSVRRRCRWTWADVGFNRFIASGNGNCCGKFPSIWPSFTAWAS